MSDFFDPRGTLIRLIRGTTYESAAGQVNKAKALSPFSAVAAEAYGRQSGEKSAQHHAPPREGEPPPDQPAPSWDEEGAVRVDFHAADALMILRTMIAAMAAAGTSQEAERQRILAYLRDTGGTAAELAFAERQMQHPATAEEIAAALYLSGRGRETAAELYAAALLVTQAANAGSRAFLASLAAGLKLEPAFVRELHAAWDDPPPAGSQSP